VIELGNILRNARIEKGLTIEDVQDSTKILKRYLVAIEEGNYDMLPESFYVRAFIRSYAEAVGLDPNEIIKLYGSSIPQPSSSNNPNLIKRDFINMKVIDRRNKWITMTIFWTFLVLLGGSIYFFVGINASENADKAKLDMEKPLTGRKQSETWTLTPTANQKMQVQLQNITPTPTPTPTPQSVVKLLRTEFGTDIYQISKSTNISVQMSVIGKACWVQLDQIINGERAMIEQGTLTTGNVKIWDNLEKPLYITLGAANAIELKVNGVPIPVGDSSNVRRFQFEF
jgi:cytoskeletal protein RodZ